MQRLNTCLYLILGFVAPCFCDTSFVGTNNTFFNVIDYGAKGDGKSDDTQAFVTAWQHACGTQGASTLVIPPKTVFLVRNLRLEGPCNATSILIQLQGEIVAPAKNEWINGLTIDEESNLILISKVNSLTVDGNGGLIDGYGSTWWACKRCTRPMILKFLSCNDLSVSNLMIINSPKAHIHVNFCDGAILSNINISAPGDSPNTDGIDISSSKNIIVEDSTFETGDDCIAITGNSSYINATRIACGPGHGISIGSLGRNNANDRVEEVHVRNCTFTNTKNGARIKTWIGGSGYARKIYFEQIILSQAKNPIIINQYYSDYVTNGGLEVSDVTYRGFQGTSLNDKAITLNCSSSGCFNIVLDQINIVSSEPGATAYCTIYNARGTATSTVPNCSLST
ncbi:probable polygalacturonase At3g15720 [Cajanus cajan]|uniref:probable polygalacturonase At3g15720 n=1 Tax=Cajanus cajan TaxID=3821 RepID=UPI00098D88FC|nr:probable polygalacturonase At3g15720 [Cajanus cajan]